MALTGTGNKGEGRQKQGRVMKFSHWEMPGRLLLEATANGHLHNGQSLDCSAVLQAY